MPKTSVSIVPIAILVYPGCLRSGAVVPADVFAIANTVMQTRPAQQHLKFEPIWVSARGVQEQEVSGLRFAINQSDQRAWQALMVPGIHHQDPHELGALLNGLAPEKALLNQILLQRRLLIASCSSTCLLAETGNLAGRKVTTSWWLSAYFRKHYPAVQLEAEELIVVDDQLVSSGGVSSYLDLALWVVGHFAGDEVRHIVAKILVLDAQRDSQSPYVASAMVQSQGHAVVERARRWLNQHLAEEWTMTQLATYCHVSQRTLLRRFQEAMGLSPVQYAQQLRIERAKALLEASTISLEEVTSRCGYQDVSTLSKIFKKWTHITPKEYRNRFSLRA